MAVAASPEPPPRPIRTADEQQEEAGSVLCEGVRVLDLSRLLPGPYATRLLADLGADVIKVEDPAGGDPVRHVPPLADGVGVWFTYLHRGKRSIRLDLKHPQGRAALLRLAATADAVIEGFRPGVLDRLGLGWDDLAQANPRLVLCSVSGYGAEGPYRDRAGHDLNYQALAGLLSLMPAGPDGAPLPPPLQVADMAAGGLLAALAVAGGVLRARAAGVGVRVEAAMLDGLLSLGGLFLAEGTLAGSGPQREDLALAGRLACYGTYAVAGGGAVALGALEPRFWAAFCQLAGREDWVPRQYDPDQKALKAEVAKLFASRTRDQWAALAATAPDACLEPVLTPAEVPQHPAAAARGQFGPLAAGRPALAGSPLRVNGARPGADGPVPAYGEHTRDVLAAVGYTPAQLDDLAAAGVI